jgi:F420H(2)-dependent quinone reductase
MAERFLYLTTTGRSTGLPRDIEIWFVEHAGRYYLISERREASGWVQNLRKEARVRFSIGSRTAPEEEVPSATGRARVVEGVEGDEDLVRAARGLMDAKYGWSDGLVVEIAPD